MVVKINRFLTLVAAGCLSLSVLASEQKQPNVDRLAFQIAANELNKAVAEAGKMIEDCKALESSLSPDLFKDINLEQEKLFKAIAFFSRKASAECTQAADTQFLVALTNWQEAVKHNPDIKEMILGDQDPEGLSELITGNNWSYLKLNAEFLLLDEKERKKFEAISELKKPFKLMDTLRKLGL